MTSTDVANIGYCAARHQKIGVLHHTRHCAHEVHDLLPPRLEWFGKLCQQCIFWETSQTLVLHMVQPSIPACPHAMPSKCVAAVLSSDNPELVACTNTMHMGSGVNTHTRRTHNMYIHIHHTQTHGISFAFPTNDTRRSTSSSSSVWEPSSPSSPN